MAKLKIGIVEDEMIIAHSMAATLEAIGYEVASVASSYDEAIIMLHEEKPDLVVLDINIRGKKDGIDIAWHIKNEYDIPFIFLTAIADIETLNRAKQTQPPAYLVKPFSRDDLFTSIEICLYNHTQKKELTTLPADQDDLIIKDTLFIKEGTCFHKIKFADILYLESEHVYVYVHTIGKKIIVRSTMQNYLIHFAEQKFIRIHRSFVVNLEHVQTINAENVIINGVSLPIGRTFKEELLNIVKPVHS
jgi:two-component system, LytTR family, response regulator LytT